MAYTPQINYPAYNPYQQMPMQYQQPIQQTAPQPMQTQPMYQARPVTSREEALGQQVDFFGAGTLMPDLALGIIYLKRFNQNTGASDLFEFCLAQTDAPQEQPNELEEIRASIKRLEDEIAQMRTSKAKVVKKNDDE